MSRPGICRKYMRFEFIYNEKLKTEGEFLMSSLMLFQDLALTNLTDLKPCCSVFL